MRERELIHIRDPIHGTLPVSVREIRVIDHPVFQRLRNIKQLGFADLAFPGATHTRYSHSLGAMWIATRLFDTIFRPGDLPDRVHRRFRQAVRLAMMLHDVGHAPLSHTTEMLMPPVGELGLGIFAGDDVSRKATHEDYTLKIVLDSSLASKMRENFESDGIVPEDIAELIMGQTWQGTTSRFRYSGVDYAPVLRQLVSSEVDADRMDYLQRDSFYSGVSYGKFDADWLIDNVVPVQKDNAVYLGIKSRAIFSFEDFLLSRYHMFASVYLHYTPVIFEKMLSRYFDDAEGEFGLPADVEEYAKLDDIDLWATLRKSDNHWARRVVERRSYTMLHEQHEGQGGTRVVDADTLVEALVDAGVDHIATRSKSTLSKYFKTRAKAPMFVVEGTGNAQPLESFTPLYARYETPATLTRVFVSPEQRVEARRILAAHIVTREDAAEAAAAATKALADAGAVPSDQVTSSHTGLADQGAVSQARPGMAKRSALEGGSIDVSAAAFRQDGEG